MKAKSLITCVFLVEKILLNGLLIKFYQNSIIITFKVKTLTNIKTYLCLEPINPKKGNGPVSTDFCVVVGGPADSGF